MTSTVPHVRKRGQTYQFERRVPNEARRDLDKYARYFRSNPLYRISLRTKDPAEVYAAADLANREFERLLALASGKRERVIAPPSRSLRKLTETDLEAIQQTYLELTARPFENAHLLADCVEGGAEELERMHSELELFADQISDSLKPGARKSDVEGIDTPAEAAAFVIEQEGFDAPEGSPAYAQVVSAIRSARKIGHTRIMALSDGEVLPSPPPTAAKVAASKSITICEAVTRYLDHKGLPPKTEGEVKLSLRIFSEVIGDKALDKLTRDDFKQYVEHLAGQKVGGKSVGSIKRSLSAETVTKRLSLLRSAIKHAEHRGWYSGVNPALGIDVDVWVKPRDKTLMPDKRGFTVGDLNKLFKHPWFTGCLSADRTHEAGSYRLEGDEYWAPVVALFTGCRASELGGLKLDEVRIDDDHPHLVIRDNEFRRTKSGYARNVPLLDALLALGFGDYVHRIAKGGHKRLFPDWESPKGAGFAANDAAWANASVIRSFNRTVVPAALADTLLPGARQTVTFHSFRGAFKTMLCSSRYALHPNVIDDVIGHAKTKVEKAYSNIALEDAHRLVRACTWDKLEVPKLPA